jgi:hypothetical protein
MHDTSPSPSCLTDDDVRWIMVRTAASLARLWARLDRIPRQAGTNPMKAWCSQHIDPPEAWLDAVPYNVALSGVIRAVLLAQGLLIDEAVAKRPPDRRRVCLIVQHIQCGALGWSANTLRLARTLGVDLGETPRHELHGSSLHNEIHQLDGSFAKAKAARGDASAKVAQATQPE